MPKLMHAGPFTSEDLDRFYSAVFASRSSDPPKVLGRLNKSSCGSLQIATKRGISLLRTYQAAAIFLVY
jgi:hypothetical protein